MPELIVHHFDPSPFAEKTRLAMGIKSLQWRSVEIPMIMPKPQLMPLTGGYRKTPVLQVGAEVYCDTGLIFHELEQRFPEPGLFTPGGAALEAALAAWSDRTFFEPGAGLSMAMNDNIPEPLLDDRKGFFAFMDFDQLSASVPHMTDQFLAQVSVLENQLGHGKDFLTGDTVRVPDILGYFPVWMLRGNVPGGGQWLEEFGRVCEWEKRMQNIGHGQRTELDPSEALAIAAASSPGQGEGVLPNGADLKHGQRVSATPTDYGAVPVVGELITLNRQKITLRRNDPMVGEVNVHFPRAGFRVEKTSD